MDKYEIRIECLKLLHRHDKTPEQVVNSAKVYEKFVLGPVSEEVRNPSVTTALGNKRLGNPFTANGSS